MGEASVQALGNFDTSFKKFLSSRMVGEEDRAMEEIETCRRLLSKLIIAVCRHTYIICIAVYMNAFCVLLYRQ